MIRLVNLNETIYLAIDSLFGSSFRVNVTLGSLINDKNSVLNCNACYFIHRGELCQESLSRKVYKSTALDKDEFSKCNSDNNMVTIYKPVSLFIYSILNRLEKLQNLKIDEE